MPSSEASKYIFSVMFSPTIGLLLGGFTIAAVLSKTRLDVMTASRVLNAAGSKPSVVLLVLMCIATFASMWISNVAAPTLCYALIKVGFRRVWVRRSDSLISCCSPSPTSYHRSLRSLDALSLVFLVAIKGDYHQLNPSRPIDCHRPSIQYWWTSLAHLVSSESHWSGCHGPTLVVATMVRHLTPSGYRLGRRHLVIPSHRLPLGTRPHHPPNEEEHGPVDLDALVRAVHHRRHHLHVVYREKV
jgi:hypothetical protein